MNKQIVYVILFIIGFTSLERFCHKQTHGFRLNKIQSIPMENTDWENALPTNQNLKELHEILSQPYYFLNSGGESYAFVSKDGKTVLKFFKHHHMRPHHWVDHFLPFSLKKKFQKNRQDKLLKLFTSCSLAYQNFREGTGLIYLHLTKTDHFSKKLTLYDAIGAIHHINLDTTDFALQHKASMAYPTITHLADAGEYDAAKQRLASLVNLVVQRCKAGLADHDARKRNFGFIGNHAIEIDLGSFSEDLSLKNEEATKKILLLETLRLRRWIKKYHPELSDFLEDTIKQHLSQK